MQWAGCAARSVVAHPALAVGVAAAAASVWTFAAAGAAALVTDIARGATLALDAREAFAVVTGRATLRVLATVPAVPVALRAAAALTGTRPALAVIVAGAALGVRALHATVAATPATEIARGATLSSDACLKLSTRRVVGAILPDCHTRKAEQSETTHYHRYCGVLIGAKECPSIRLS